MPARHLRAAVGVRGGGGVPSAEGKGDPGAAPMRPSVAPERGAGDGSTACRAALALSAWAAKLDAVASG